VFARYLLTMAVADGQAANPGQAYPVNNALNLFYFL
jgi:hypothetical protein